MTTATICNLSALFLSCFIIASFTRRRLRLQLCSMFYCHARCFFFDGYERDLSQLSMTPLALVTGLLSAVGVMFNVILPQRFCTAPRICSDCWLGMILAGLFSNFLYPIYQISFQVDLVSVLICLTIAVFGTAFAFFLSMKAVSLFPLVVSVVSARNRSLQLY